MLTLLLAAISLLCLLLAVRRTDVRVIQRTPIQMKVNEEYATVYVIEYEDATVTFIACRDKFIDGINVRPKTGRNFSFKGRDKNGRFKKR